MATTRNRSKVAPKRQPGYVQTVLSQQGQVSGGELPANFVCVPMQILATPEPIRGKKRGRRKGGR
jgi:hypothetical protein